MMTGFPRFLGRTLLVLIALGASLALCRAQPGPPPDMERIRVSGELRIAMTVDFWPPFYYLNKKKELAGADIDMATEIARRLGVRVRFVREAKTFDEIVTMVVDRRADIAVAYLSDTLDRAKLVRFTRPYVQVKPAVLLNRSLVGHAHRGPDLKHLLDHPEARIGVTKGSSAEGFATADYPLAKIISYESWTDVTRDLTAEKLLAGVSDEIDARSWQTANPEGSITIETLIREGPPDTMGIAVHREDLHLLYWINHFLSLKEADGSLASLHHKYIENDLWKKDLQ
jgi:polar amino acid transport system substrate-binding protein